MGRNTLADLFEQASEQVVAPPLAAAAWAKARRVRRGRRAALAGAAAVLALTAAVVLPLRGGSETGPPVAQPAPSSAPGEVDELPATLPRRAVAPLPAAGLAPSAAKKLSEHRLDRAVAALMPYGTTTLYALGADGTWVRVDTVTVVQTHDAGGNAADPLRATSLSPDGRRIAVPQPDAVVVVDLTTGAAHRVAVPGLNEQVVWWGDRYVLVGAGGPGAVRVDWAAGTTAPVAAALSTWNVAGDRAEGAPLVELTATGSGPDPANPPRPSVRTWQLDRPGAVADLPLDDSRLDGAGVQEWYGPALRGAGDRVVRAGWGRTPTTTGGNEIVALVNARTGAVERLLDLGMNRSKGCCRPLDWADADTVLVQTDKEGLITWNVRTGALALAVTGPVDGTLAVRLP